MSIEIRRNRSSRPSRAMRIAAAALAAISVPSCDRPPEHRGRRDANAETVRPAPAPAWTTSELGDLLHAVQAADREGLRPADYGVDGLEDATAGGRTGAAVDTIANGAALALSRDFAAGRIRNRHRFNWYIDYAGPSQVDLFRQLTAARTQGRLGAFLNGLLPTSADYGALRETLATLPPGTATAATASSRTWSGGAGCRATWGRATSSTSTCPPTGSR